MGAAKVNGGTAGGAAVVDCITAGGAVEVNCGAVGRQQGSKVSVLMTVRCQHQVVIVGRTFGARSINWSLDRRRIGAIVRSVGL